MGVRPVVRLASFELKRVATGDEVNRGKDYASDEAARKSRVFSVTHARGADVRGAARTKRGGPNTEASAARAACGGT
jgi:hypothetical protein